MPRQIIFIHIPKSGGTSIAEYFRDCIGSSRRGRYVFFHDGIGDKRARAHNFAKAKKATFVSGHISWATFEEIRNPHGSFVFTFLREPHERLRSFYFFIKNFAAHKVLVEDIAHLGPCDFITNPHPLVRYHVDNFVVRQLSGTLDTQIGDSFDGLQRLEIAKRNLLSMNFVGFTDSINTDLANLADMLGLSKVLTPP